MDFKDILNLTKEIADIGKRDRRPPSFFTIEPFKHYHSSSGVLIENELDKYDGKYSRREILARYLLVNAVLDQGPDMAGVGELLKQVTTNLYRQEIRIFHKPIDFFRELGISIDEILDTHESVKKIRAERWAKENNTSSNRYNLFFAQSMRGIISTNQVLDYAVHRWGVPLCVPLLLEKDLQKNNRESKQPLIDYLESYDSAEIMSSELKDNEKYGLGSAIGDKACHLFAKTYVSVFNLVKHKKNDTGWTGISYETPFDSNAGRVMFRTGYLLALASLDKYEEMDVIRKNEGKNGTHYIRVTNIRGIKTSVKLIEPKLFQYYVDIVKNYLKVGKAPRSIEIQRVPLLMLYVLNLGGAGYSAADFDDGLMEIGTRYCFNHDKPNCQACPVNKFCYGFKKNKSLIKDYTT